MSHSISLFDLDHTLFRVNSSFSFGKYLYAQQLFSTKHMLYFSWCYWRHKALGMPLMDLHTKIFGQLFSGRTLDQVEQEVEVFLHENFDDMVNPCVAERLDHCQRRGDHTVILSNSPSFLVQAIARRFGVDEWYATLYRVDENGHLKDIVHVLEGKDKARMLGEIASRLEVPRENVCAFSDSYLDLPFLEAAGQAVAVSPDRKLRKACLKKGWKVIDRLE